MRTMEVSNKALRNLVLLKRFKKKKTTSFSLRNLVFFVQNTFFFKIFGAFLSWTFWDFLGFIFLGLTST